MKFFILMIVFLAFPVMIYAQEYRSNNFHVYYPRQNSPKAVCLVIHGLNNKPSSMQWIRSELLKHSAIVIEVELWGHGNNPVVVSDSTGLKERMYQFKQVTWVQWLNDTKPAIDFIDSAFTDKNIPKYFFGFSLGGLVGVSIGNEYDFNFDGYFLLAPAIKIKSLLKISIGLMSPFPKKVIKSKTPEYYRENYGTPVAAYKALLTGAKQFKNANPQLGNCVIIIDKKDRLVSARKLARFAAQNNFTIEIIQKEKKECAYCNIKHLIIDKESLGSYSTFVSEKIDSFFK